MGYHKPGTYEVIEFAAGDGTSTTITRLGSLLNELDKLSKKSRAGKIEPDDRFLNGFINYRDVSANTETAIVCFALSTKAKRALWVTLDGKDKGELYEQNGRLRVSVD